MYPLISGFCFVRDSAEFEDFPPDPKRVSTPPDSFFRFILREADRYSFLETRDVARTNLEGEHGC